MDRPDRVKRIGILTAVFLFAAASVTYSSDKRVGFSTFLDSSWVFPVGLAFHPGAELTFYSLDPDGDMIFELGAAVTGQVAYANRIDLWSFTTFGASIAPIVVLSFDDGFKETNRFIERLAFSISPGVGFNFYIYAGDPAYYISRDTIEIGFSVIAGGRISLTRFVAIRLDAMYWGRYIGPNLAVGLQLDLW